MEKIIRLDCEKEYRVVAISDLHGHYDRFVRLLDRVNLDDRDYLFIVGDFINRGPDSYRLYELMKELEKRDRTIILKGNHESFIYRAITDETIGDRFLNFLQKDYFETIIDDILDMEDIDKQEISSGDRLRDIIVNNYSHVLDFLDSRPIYVEFDNYIFVHGGYDDSFDIEEDEVKFLKYDDFDRLSGVNNKVIVVGHWPTCNLRDDRECNDPMFNREKNIISIDGGTGIKVSGELNALIIEKDSSGGVSYYNIQENDFKPSSITSSEEHNQEELVYVRYPNTDIELLKKGRDKSTCRHLHTGKEFTVFNGLIRDGEKGVVLKQDYINRFFNLDKGTNVEVCKVYDDCALVKHNKEFGWISRKQLHGLFGKHK